MLVLAAASVTGCHEPARPDLLTYLPMSEAITLLNRNNYKVDMRLYGAGRWTGTMVDADGDPFPGHGQFRLHYARPDRLCFEAKDLGVNYFEVGCNGRECWFWQQYRLDRMILGSRQEMEGLSFMGIPIDPRTLMDALGVQLIEISGRRPVYRVTADHHQLLFEQTLGSGEPVIVKEYWLARREPFCIERVVYRDFDGRSVLEVALAGFKRLPEDGPFVAHRIRIHWPQTGSNLNLEFSRLSQHPDVDSIWFEQPADRPQRDNRHRAPKSIVSPNDLSNEQSARLP